MKVNEIRKCRGQRLSGYWDWSVHVWFGLGMFADVTLKSTPSIGFVTEEAAIANMENVLKKLKIETKNKNERTSKSNRGMDKKLCRYIRH